MSRALMSNSFGSLHIRKKIDKSRVLAKNRVFKGKTGFYLPLPVKTEVYSQTREISRVWRYRVHIYIYNVYIYICVCLPLGWKSTWWLYGGYSELVHGGCKPRNISAKPQLCSKWFKSTRKNPIRYPLNQVVRMCNPIL